MVQLETAKGGAPCLFNTPCELSDLLMTSFLKALTQPSSYSLLTLHKQNGLIFITFVDMEEECFCYCKISL